MSIIFELNDCVTRVRNSTVQRLWDEGWSQWGFLVCVGEGFLCVILRIKRSSLVSCLKDKRGSPFVIFIWQLKETQKERGEE